MRVITAAVVMITGRFVECSDWQQGRSTTYGVTDQFHSDWGTGTCKCWGESSYRADVPCFDSILPPSHIAAVDTSGMKYTGTCGTCVLVTCVDGPTRGLPYSTYPESGCLPGNPAVLVQVTDSCPCEQNESNKRWCCQDTGRGVRHLDLATPAFTTIAQEAAGVVDVLFQQVQCPPSGQGSGAVWDTWQQQFGTTIEKWSASQQVDTLASVESACVGAESVGFDTILGEDIMTADDNRTISNVTISPKFARPGLPLSAVYESSLSNSSAVDTAI